MTYSESILANNAPVKAVDIMRNRLNGAKLLNDDIADWLRERVRIEEHYANELNKLSKKGLGTSSANLGTLAEAWNEIVHGLRENSKASESYARRLRGDIEQPIKNFSQKSTAWSDLRTTHDDLSTLAKQFMESEAALTKAKRKSQVKAGPAYSHLNQIQSQWESQAPLIFDQFETVDEARLAFLKDSLTSFQTMEIDKAQTGTKAGERCLNALLTYEPKDEIQSFVANTVVGDGSSDTVAPAVDSGLVGSIHANNHSSSNLRRSTTDSTNDLSTSQRIPPPRSFTSADDSSSIKSRDGVKLRSKVGSIFRSSKNKKKEKEREREKEREQFRELDRHRNVQQSQQPTRATTTPEVKKPVSKPAPPPSRKLNGPLPETPENAETNFSNNKNNINNIASAKSDEQLNDSNIAAEDPEPTESNLKINIRNEAITEEDGDGDDIALSQLATTLRKRNTQSSRTRGRRDIQSRLFTGIEASEVENQNALAGNVQSPPQQLLSQLQEFAGENGNAPPNNTSEPPPQASPNGSQQPFSTSPSPQQSAGVQPIGNASSISTAAGQDIQSLHSLRSTATGGALSSIRHPELPFAKGLSSTIVEVINCTLKDGVPAESFVGGEVALGYNETPGEITPSYSYIRVNNASSAEKVSSNPAFVQAASPGLFKVYISSGLIGLTNGVVGIKYSRQRVTVPIIFMPVWRIEERQLSLMLTSKLSDDYQGDQVTLSDLNITVPIQGGLATSAQSKPMASFNKELQRITWRFTEPMIFKRGTEERFLCRFATETAAHEAVGGIKVKFRINNALPIGPNPITLDYKAKERDPFLAEGESEGSSENLNGSTASNGGWRQVACVRSVVTGQYQSSSEANVHNK